MADVPTSTKIYFVTGWAFWFLLRWAIYIGLFLIMFRLGGMQGSFWERVRQLSPPRLLVIFPDRAPLPPTQPPDLEFGYYTVVVRTAPDRITAEQVKARLRASRIESEIIAENGFFTVAVGKYATLDAANTTLQKVRQHGFAGARVAGQRQR